MYTFSPQWQGFGWLVLAILLTPLYLVWRTFAPWVPVKAADLPRILGLVKLGPNDLFVDLGCGDGRVVEYVARHSEARALGVELAYPMYLWSKIRFWLNPNPRVKIRFANLFNVSLREATVIYVFGMPKTVSGKFEKKCLEELPKGAQIISYCFEMDGWEPEVIHYAKEGDLSIYLYSIDRIREMASAKAS